MLYLHIFCLFVYNPLLRNENFEIAILGFSLGNKNAKDYNNEHLLSQKASEGSKSTWDFEK